MQGNTQSSLLLSILKICSGYTEKRPCYRGTWAMAEKWSSRSRDPCNAVLVML